MVDLVERVGPVIGFLVALTIVAEISERAGVFDVAAHWAARVARGSVLRLWLLIVVLAVASTIVLSLDTTAVLLTPVVLAVARQAKLDGTLFALTTVWLANTASLLLPVSNLTNLLALHSFSRIPDHPSYLSVMWRPALAAILATVVVAAILYRRQLRGRYVTARPADPHDRVLLLTAAGVCVALGPLFVSGIMSRRRSCWSSWRSETVPGCARSTCRGAPSQRSSCCSWWSTSPDDTASPTRSEHSRARVRR